MASAQRKSKLAKFDLAELDEMAQDPGFKGMLSFLDMPPDEKKRLLDLRREADINSPMGELPMGHSSQTTEVLACSIHHDSDLPMGHSPMGALTEEPVLSKGFEPSKQPTEQSLSHTESITPARFGPGSVRPVRPITGQQPMGQSPMGQLLATTEAARNSPPYYVAEGVGRRRLHYCTSVQDAHTAGEIVAYQTLWTHAKKFGRSEPSGFVVDLGLKELCGLWKTDHKHAKHLLSVLIEKLNIEIVRQPNYQAGIPTRYRVFNFSQIYERRRGRGLVWVLRTRTIRFIELEIVSQLITQTPMGDSPTGESLYESESPMGQQPQSPMGQQDETPMGQQPTHLIKESTQGSTQGNRTSTHAVLAHAIHETTGLIFDDNGAANLIAACRHNAPDATDAELTRIPVEVLLQAIREKRHKPIGWMIRMTPGLFAPEALRLFRAERQAEAEQQRVREAYWAAEAEKTEQLHDQDQSTNQGTEDD
jgi:hypothetical protein